MTEPSHAHPTPKQYVRIAVVLAVLTGIEVTLYYINQANDLGVINTLMLLGLAGLKFVGVVGWYMHLRYEKAVLNRFFAGGLTLAIILYGIVLTSFGVLVAGN